VSPAWLGLGGSLIRLRNRLTQRPPPTQLHDQFQMVETPILRSDKNQGIFFDVYVDLLKLLRRGPSLSLWFPMYIVELQVLRMTLMSISATCTRSGTVGTVQLKRAARWSVSYGTTVVSRKCFYYGAGHLVTATFGQRSNWVWKFFWKLHANFYPSRRCLASEKHPNERQISFVPLYGISLPRFCQETSHAVWQNCYMWINMSQVLNITFITPSISRNRSIALANR
jgi:hypothetical protein